MIIIYVWLEPCAHLEGHVCSCTAGPTTPAAAPTPTPTASSSVGTGSREVATLTPRVLLAREGGLTLLDSATGAVVEEVDRDGAFHKVKAPDTYARTGNAAGSPTSPVVLTDDKVDNDAEQERTTRVALVDTRTDSLKLVDVGASYWFR